jgi:hypothetical protein
VGQKPQKKKENIGSVDNAQKRINMEETQKAVVVIGGIQYDASNASQATGGLIQDLTTVQAELNRLKTSYDIVNIARGTLLQGISQLIESGESGLVEIPVETTEETTEEAAQ